MIRTSQVRFWVFLPLLSTAALLAGCSQPTPVDSATGTSKEPGAVSIQVVKSPALEAAIATKKGSIVVADFWATWCAPCKRDFHHLVELHERFGKQGVACLSVTVDDEEDKGDALDFLREQHAAFPNYLLDEEPMAWQERWHMKGVPAVFVFGRDGKLVQKFDKDDPDKQFTYADVNKLVEQLLAKSE